MKRVLYPLKMQYTPLWQGDSGGSRADIFFRYRYRKFRTASTVDDMFAKSLDANHVQGLSLGLVNSDWMPFA